MQNTRQLKIFPVLICLIFLLLANCKNNNEPTFLKIGQVAIIEFSTPQTAIISEIIPVKLKAAATNSC